MKTYSRIGTKHIDCDTYIAKRRRISSDDLISCSDGASQPLNAANTSSPQPTPNLSSDAPQPAAQTPPSSPPQLFATTAPVKGPSVSLFACQNVKKPLTPHHDHLQRLPAVLVSKAKRKLVQMQLDLGGPVHKTCRICGMEYTPSNAEDLLLHKRFHAMNVGGVDMGKGMEAEKLWRGDDGAFIIAAGPKSAWSLKRRVEKVMCVVKADLGAVDIPSAQLWEETVQSEGEGGSKKRCHRHKAFLYIKGSKCVGLCLAEHITEAYRVAPTSSETTRPEDTKSAIESSSLSTVTDASAALVGVSRIWTSSSHRRNGIAQTLLDCTQKNFLYGVQIDKDMIAFSQPTASGAKLARSWFEEQDGWKVYADCEHAPNGKAKNESKWKASNT